MGLTVKPYGHLAIFVDPITTKINSMRNRVQAHCWGDTYLSYIFVNWDES